MPPRRRAQAAGADITTITTDPPGAAPGPSVETQEEAGAGIGLLPLFAWLSPSFPVGGYAYSHGLEWAVETGDVEREPSLLAYVSDLLEHGFPRSDAILFAHAYQAAAADDAATLREVNELAVALSPSSELRLETCQQGRSFLDAVTAAWPHPRLSRLAPVLEGEEVAYPVAVALACASHGVPLTSAMEAFMLAQVQALLSAALRLAPIGQTAAARILSALAPRIAHLARAAQALGLDEIGTATFRADLGSFRHETQYTRLFRS